MTSAQTVSVQEAAAILGVGRSRFYEMVRQGRVPVLKVGRKPRYRIPRRAVERFLDEPELFNRPVERREGGE